MSAEPSILFADDDLVVIDKPAGWLVHHAGTADPDVLSWLTLAGHGHLLPLHRIDKETSGVVLLGRTPDVARTLGEALASREVDKRYLALVHGRARKKGIIRRGLREGGKDIPAVTRYGLARWLGRFSLLRVRPETGRKHQIRRHLQGIGHAVVGDDRYGTDHAPPVPADPGRLWLHASSVALPDGRTFDAPLPPELQACLDALIEAEEARGVSG